MSDADNAEVIWRPSPARIERARVTQFINWLRIHKGLEFADYHALWQWSVDEIEACWAAQVEYFDLPLQGG